MRPADLTSAAAPLQGRREGKAGLDERGDALADLGRDLRAGGQAGLQDVLEPGADGLGLRADQPDLRLGVLGDRLGLTLEAVAALTQLTLDLGARALDLALQRATGRLATALGLAQLGLELALGLVARAVLRADLVDRVDDAVAGQQRGADLRQHGALGDVLRVVLGRTRLARRGALGGRGARLGAGRGALASGGAALRRTSLSGL